VIETVNLNQLTTAQLLGLLNQIEIILNQRKRTQICLDTSDRIMLDYDAKDLIINRTKIKRSL